MKDKFVHIHSEALGDIPLPSFFPIEKTPVPPTPFPQNGLFERSNEPNSLQSVILVELLGHLSESAKAAQCALDFSVDKNQKARELSFSLRNRTAIYLEEAKLLAKSFGVEKFSALPPAPAPTNFFEAVSLAKKHAKESARKLSRLIFIAKEEHVLVEFMRLYVLLLEEVENISEYI